MNETTPETVAPLSPHLEAIRARLHAAWQGAAPGATLPRIETLKGHSGMVISVCFNPGGRRLASGGEDRTVKV